MGKKASKKAVKQLQKIYNVLGENGGQIHTDSPGTWWALNMESQEMEENLRDMQIGIFTQIEGDCIFDPEFRLRVKTEGNTILEAEIYSYESGSMFGTVYVDEEDILHGAGMSEKDPYGLRKRFSNFMENMTEIGPYLSRPEKVVKY